MRFGGAALQSRSSILHASTHTLGFEEAAIVRHASSRPGGLAADQAARSALVEFCRARHYQPLQE
jgi:hypothetical protein